jgi:hypothetical protein
LRIQAACHCKKIAFEAEVDPGRVTICHCTDCQQLTGTAYRVSVPTRQDAFLLVRGSPKTYIKTADSGTQRAQVFCADCGSPLYTYEVGKGTTLGLRVGCIAQRAQLRPTKQKWCASALDWSMDIRALARDTRE